MFYIKLSRKIYDAPTFSAYRRAIVFVIRAMLHYDKMEKLRTFLEETPLRRTIAAVNPTFFEQVTRSIFYRRSTFVERLKLITDHLSFFEITFTQNALQQMYLGKEILLWHSNYGNARLSLELSMHDNYLREGMMGFIFKHNNEAVYTITFWVEGNTPDALILKIGTLQGKRNGLTLYRALTKHFCGFRPKNFILFALRTLAAQLSVTQIHAVSNYGHYANNHLRLNRKLKTSFDGFWREAGGKIIDDGRFFELPIIEPQKNPQDVLSHKRNLYRKRYALLDEVKNSIIRSLEICQNHNLLK